jgi:hypothetical protein
MELSQAIKDQMHAPKPEVLNHKYIIYVPTTLDAYYEYKFELKELKRQKNVFPIEDGKIIYPPGYEEDLKEMTENLSFFDKSILKDLL